MYELIAKLFTKSKPRTLGEQIDVGLLSCITGTGVEDIEAFLDKYGIETNEELYICPNVPHHLRCKVNLYIDTYEAREKC